MSYGGLVCKIKVREHPNADNMALGLCSGYQVCVSKETEDGALGIFFQSDTQLGEEFCLENKLYRKHPETMQPMGGYLEANRRVRTIKLRGEQSDGLWLPISCFAYNAMIPEDFKIGEEINDMCGQPIAHKYVTPATRKRLAQARMPGQKKDRHPQFPTFHKHFDTPQLRANLSRIPLGAFLTFTEKLNGTSGRSGHLQCQHPRTWLQRLLRRPGKVEWKHIMGSRNVTIHDNTETIRKYNPNYEPDHSRTQHHRDLSLRKGETLYYEIVGYKSPRKSDPGDAGTGTIMPRFGLDKKDPISKEISKRFNTDVVQFTYGQEIGTSEIYVYRITMTNEDGHSTELPWHAVIRRCEELGLKHVPVLHKELWKGDDPQGIAEACKQLCEAPSTLDSNSIREGVCVRVEHPDCDHVFKYKSFWFCHLEGIKKQDDGYVDVEDIS